MSDPSNLLRLEVVGVFRNGRRRYDRASKQRLVEACLQPGASVARLALQHGVNANLLRKWVAEHQRQRSKDVAAGAIGRARDMFVPVVELCGAAGALGSPAPAPIQQRTKRARHTDPSGPRLTVEMPNGVLLQLACSGQDVALVTAIIATLGRCDVPAGR